MKILLTSSFILLVSLNIFSQNVDEKWTFGVHAGSVLYANEDRAKVGGVYIDQLPRFTISRYLFSNITLQAGLGFKSLDPTKKYTTFDGIARYDFGLSYNNVVPYILVGGSIIKANRPTPTLNIGAGNTFWISPQYGLNLQIMYKFSENRFESQFSHIYTSVGLVYSFKSRNMNRRLWDMKH